MVSSRTSSSGQHCLGKPSPGKASVLDGESGTLPSESAVGTVEGSVLITSQQMCESWLPASGTQLTAAAKGTLRIVCPGSTGPLSRAPLPIWPCSPISTRSTSPPRPWTHSRSTPPASATWETSSEEYNLTVRVPRKLGTPAWRLPRSWCTTVSKYKPAAQAISHSGGASALWALAKSCELGLGIIPPRDPKTFAQSAENHL